MKEILIESPNLRYFLVSIIVIIIAFIISALLRKLIGIFIHRNSGLIKVDPTNYSFLKHASTFVIFTLAVFLIIYNIPKLKTLGATLFAGAGIFAAILGFASQQAFSNIISGIFIVIFKPFRVGDIIEIESNKKGTVEDITLRHTVIKDFQNQRIIIPNSVISSATIINSNITDEKILKHIEFGISYQSNVDHAIKIIKEEIKAHPFFLDNRTEEEIAENKDEIDVRLIKLADSAVVLRAYVWVLNPSDAFVLNCDVNKTIKERFDKENIEIPYPHRKIFIDHGK